MTVAAISELAEHHVGVYKPFRGMLKRIGQCSYNIKSEHLPEPNGSLVSRNHGIELHGAIAETAGLIQTMLRHGAANSPALRGWIHHETGVGNVSAGAGSVRAQGVGTDNLAIGFGNIGAGVLAKPIGKRLLTRHVRINRVSVTGRDHIVENLPDGVVIALGGRPDI